MQLSRRQFSAIGLASAAALVGRGVPAALAAGPTAKFEIERTPDEWRKLLTPEQYYVMREHGTERPFTSPLDKTYAAGIYHCAACDLPLFSSVTKYNSRTGWPSFWKPIDGAIGTRDDRTLFFVRTEVHCRRCGGHLGHVFDDGPKPTGLRYCMNGVALKFVPEQPAGDKVATPKSEPKS